MEKKHEIFKRFPNKWFVETGTYAGDGVQAALDAGFENVISMDVSVENIKRCEERFKGDDRVKLFCTDSAISLGNVIADIKEPITFFLDGHWSGDGSPTGLVKIPLMYELLHIKNHPVSTHTILIDDVRCWKGMSPVRDFDLEHLLIMLNAINGWYNIQ